MGSIHWRSKGWKQKTNGGKNVDGQISQGFTYLRSRQEKINKQHEFYFLY